MNPDHLLDQARHLARRSSRRPRQADLRRAVSAAYYALFHTLCHDCASLLVGQPPAARRLAYRAVQHGEAKRHCEAVQRRAAAPTGLQEFGRALVVLQERRHDADYDPAQDFGRFEVLDLIDLAVAARRAYLGVSQTDRQHFVSEIVFRRR